MSGDLKCDDSKTSSVDLSDLLKIAMRLVPSEYVDVPIKTLAPAHAHKKHLERVYAYELYHQLRKCVPKGIQVFGEPVKSDRSLYYNTRRIPDLIIHKAGTDCNLAIIEIKSAKNLKRDGLKKDAETAKLFRDVPFKYLEAFFVCFGKDALSDRDKQLLRIVKRQFSSGFHHREGQLVDLLWGNG